MASDINHIRATIESLFEKKDVSAAESKLIDSVIEQLDSGQIRVCQKQTSADSDSSASWVVNEWIKKAILLYFRKNKVAPIESGPFSFVDKIPLKKWSGREGVRVVPQALARYGSFVSSGVVLMPSYVNIGAYIGEGSMIDTWATVGSCAQVGARVHVSGGVGIGGVLEPLQARPVVIENDAFVGSRCVLVEGVHVGESAVLGAGVTITGSTQIIDVTEKTEKVYKGYVPPRSVVIPGTRTKSFASGSYGVPCALIIGRRSPATDLKTSLNDALREFEIAI